MREKIKYLLIIIPLVLIVILAVLLVVKFLQREKKPEVRDINLTYWGIFESEEFMAPLISDYVSLFEEQNPGSTLTITYEQRYSNSPERDPRKHWDNHRELLLSRLRSDTGPDIMRVHSTWLYQFSSELTPLPASVMNNEEYASNYYPVAYAQANLKDNLYGIPLMYEGLLLLVNVDLFNEAGVAVPGYGDKLTWLEFSELAKALRKPATGKIIQAGAAIGLSQNIPHASDILGLMMAQVGVDTLEELSSQSAADALDVYRSFYTEDQVWDRSFKSSVDAFINGQVAMIFVPSWWLHDIQDLNPGLNMRATAVPQPPSTTDQTVNWANFWMETVSKDSAYPEVAWDFIKYLSSREAQLKFFSLAESVRSFGEPYPRKDMAVNLSEHKYLRPLVQGAPTAVTWFITDYAGNYPYVEIINNVIENGGDSQIALTTAQKTLQDLIKRNGIAPLK